MTLIYRTLTVGELMDALSDIPRHVHIVVCPDEPHVACHNLLHVEPWDSEDDHVVLSTLDPGPAATAARQRRGDPDSVENGVLEELG